MSYSSIALMADDHDLRKRITACAAKEGMRDGAAWVNQNMWLLAASPGWAEAWDSALLLGPGILPGRMGSVITDQMILTAVQELSATVTL